MYVKYPTHVTKVDQIVMQKDRSSLQMVPEKLCISKSVQLLYWHMACEVCGSHTVRLMLSLLQETTIHVECLTVCLCSCSISEPKSCLCCIHSCACSRWNGRNMINLPEPMCFQRNKPGRNKPGNTAYPMC